MTGPRSNPSGMNRDPLIYLGFVAVLMVQTGYMGELRAGLVAIALALFAAGMLGRDALEAYRRRQ